jgi:TonB family protein
MTPDPNISLFLPSGCLQPETVKAFLEKKLEGNDLAAVRQHLYECPFCLDAVEGFSQSGNPGAIEQIVAGLNEQISIRLAEKKLHATKRKIAVYLPIAASIILLVGVFSIFRSIRQIPTGNDNQRSILQSDYAVKSTESPVAMNIMVPKKLMPPETKVQTEKDGAVNILPENVSAKKNKENEKTVVPDNSLNREDVPQPSVTEELSSAAETGPSENNAVQNVTETTGNSQSYPAKEIASGPSGEDLNFYYHVEEMPRFRSGDLGKFRDYVQTSLRYPREALHEGIEGTVYVSFVVSPDGKVLKPAVIQGISPVLDKEALRAVASSPDWKPGSHKGNKVSVGFIIPVKFQIEQ